MTTAPTHGLDDKLVPLGTGEEPYRLRSETDQAVLFAFGAYSFEQRAGLAGAKIEGDEDDDGQAAKRAEVVRRARERHHEPPPEG